MNSYFHGYEIYLNYGIKSIDFLLKYFNAGVDKLDYVFVSKVLFKYIFAHLFTCYL